MELAWKDITQNILQCWLFCLQDLIFLKQPEWKPTGITGKTVSVLKISHQRPTLICLHCNCLILLETDHQENTIILRL